MKAKVVGFRLNPSPGVPMESVLKFLEDQGQTEVKIGKAERVVATYRTDGFFYGIVVTPKKRGVISFLVEPEGGPVKTEIQRLGKGRRQMEANLFVLNPTAAPDGWYNGLYVMAPESCSCGSLCCYMKRLHDLEADAMLTKELAKLPPPKLDPKGFLANRAARKAAKQKFRDLKFMLRVREDELKEIIEDYEAVRSVRYAITTNTHKVEDGVVFTDLLRKETKLLTFQPKVKPDDAVYKDIKTLMSQEQVEKVSATFEDAFGNVDTILLGKPNLKFCEEFQLDEIAETLAMDDVNMGFSDSDALKKIRQIATKNKAWL